MFSITYLRSLMCFVPTNCRPIIEPYPDAKTSELEWASELKFTVVIYWIRSFLFSFAIA